MAGMLQIITYLLAFYLVIKGLEILTIVLASDKERRGKLLIFAVLVLVACAIAAAAFVQMQDTQAASISQH